MNSQAPSVMAWRLYHSAISARLVYLREIGRTAFWEFCNTICQLRTRAPQQTELNSIISSARAAQQIDALLNAAALRRD
jgi:hypothetical protein